MFKITLFSLLLLTSTAHAAEVPTYSVIMQGGAFSPARINVPIDRTIHLIIRNEERARVEVDSATLGVSEKIGAGRLRNVYVGPLDAGSYEIVNDVAPDAKVTLVAIDPKAPVVLEEPEVSK